MAMFDLEDCPDAFLGKNKTSQATLVKGRNLPNLVAIENEAAIEVKSPPEDILEIKPNISGVGINFNALFRWLQNKLLSRG